MDLRTYFKTTKPADREALARAAGTSSNYLYLCSRGERLPGPALCRRLIDVGGPFTLSELRPDIWGNASPSLSAQSALTPADCNLHGSPPSLHAFVEMAVQQFGMSAGDAETLVRAVAATAGIPLDEVGHG